MRKPSKISICLVVLAMMLNSGCGQSGFRPQAHPDQHEGKKAPTIPPLSQADFEKQTKEDKVVSRTKEDLKIVAGEMFLDEKTLDLSFDKNQNSVRLKGEASVNGKKIAVQLFGEIDPSVGYAKLYSLDKSKEPNVRGHAVCLNIDESGTFSCEKFYVNVYLKFASDSFAYLYQTEGPKVAQATTAAPAPHAEDPEIEDPLLLKNPGAEKAEVDAAIENGAEKEHGAEDEHSENETPAAPGLWELPQGIGDLFKEETPKEWFEAPAPKGEQKNEPKPGAVTPKPAPGAQGSPATPNAPVAPRTQPSRPRPAPQPQPQPTHRPTQPSRGQNQGTQTGRGQPQRGQTQNGVRSGAQGATTAPRSTTQNRPAPTTTRQPVQPVQPVPPVQPVQPRQQTQNRRPAPAAQPKPVDPRFLQNPLANAQTHPYIIGAQPKPAQPKPTQTAPTVTRQPAPAPKPAPRQPPATAPVPVPAPAPAPPVRNVAPVAIAPEPADAGDSRKDDGEEDGEAEEEPQEIVVIGRRVPKTDDHSVPDLSAPFVTPPGVQAIFCQFWSPIARYGCTEIPRLVNATSLDKESPFYQVQSDKERFFGTKLMIDFITRIGKRLHQAIRDYRIGILDITDRNGGPQWKDGQNPNRRISRGTRRLLSHTSHMNGLDADIRYVLKDDNARGYGPAGVVGRGGMSRDKVHMDHQWSLFKAAVKTNYVSQIFVNRSVKTAFCSYARQKGDYESSKETLHRLRSASGHTSHWHLRLRCPDGALRCRNEPAPSRLGRDQAGC